jgi:23S rRNA pseudouridine2604 synthase
MKIRLNKYISDTGTCSRREADKLIAEGRVLVNGVVPDLGTKVSDEDEIIVDGAYLRAKEKPIYIAFHKPVGITCTTDLKDKDSLLHYLKYSKRIFPVGRLDKPSEGLIFLTNDGDIVNKILRAGNQHEKEYLVTVHRPVTPEFIKAMGNGVNILDTVTKKCFVKQEGKNLFKIILTQGLNRQIRRMCEVLGYQVTQLRRTRIMNVTLKGIQYGAWRYLTAEEIAEIKRLVAHSSKTEEASVIAEEID